MRKSEQFAAEAALWLSTILIIGICLITVFLWPRLVDGELLTGWMILTTSNGLTAAFLIYLSLRSKRLAKEKNRSERIENE